MDNPSISYKPFAGLNTYENISLDGREQPTSPIPLNVGDMEIFNQSCALS
ncbi:MAG: hypothetical protein ACTSR3_23760 [Candidatus Helarchaeota archaeon]